MFFLHAERRGRGHDSAQSTFHTLLMAVRSDNTSNVRPQETPAFSSYTPASLQSGFSSVKMLIGMDAGDAYTHTEILSDAHRHTHTSERAPALLKPHRRAAGAATNPVKLFLKLSFWAGEHLPAGDKEARPSGAAQELCRGAEAGRGGRSSPRGAARRGRETGSGEAPLCVPLRGEN